MVTEGFLPNGQPNGHSHPGIFPNGQPNGHGHPENFPNGQWSRLLGIDPMEKLATYKLIFLIFVTFYISVHDSFNCSPLAPRKCSKKIFTKVTF